MYSYIKGELAEIGTESITVEASGIGYCIYISSMAFSYLPSIGEDVKIYTYLYVREDAMILYGFLDKDDLYVFKQLITVSGIGPKGALGILSVYLQMIYALRFYLVMRKQYQRLLESVQKLHSE